MSWLTGSVAPTPTGPQLPALGAGSLHPVSARYAPDQLFGSLADEDTMWLAQTSGFVTETQTFYVTLEGGRLGMVQVIHSAIGLWYAQIQFTFRYFDPATKEHVWKSANSDQFTISLDPANPNTYNISGKYDDEVQINFTFTRPAGVPGWKIGSDARGGLTYFGAASNKPTVNPDLTASADGYMVHRFWPRCNVGGTALIKGKMVELDGGRGIFIHAIQGMRPNLIASRWNFCNFQSPASSDDGVSLTLMEFTTVGGGTYGPPKKITVGSIVVGDKLVSVSCGPDTITDVQAVAAHQPPNFFDPVTEYKPPSGIIFNWAGPSLLANPDGTAVATALPGCKAEIKLDLAEEGCKDGDYVTKGLVEKVDVMAHIPYLVKKVVATVAGARPYIYTPGVYQWMNPVTAKIEVPAQLLKGGEGAGSEVKTIEVVGNVFVEATYVSD